MGNTITTAGNRTAAATAALAGFANPAGDSVAAIAGLFDFVRPGSPHELISAVDRYTAAIELLETDPQRAGEVRHHVLQLLSERKLIGFFADSGVLPSTGFFTEFGRIVASRVLPELPDARELRGALHQIFHHRRDWVWFSAMPSELSSRFWHLIARETPGDQAMVRSIVDQMIEALLILAYRIGGIDTEAEFGRLGPEFGAFAACFRGLTGCSQRYADAARAHLADPEVLPVDSGEVLVLVDQCNAVIDRARRLSSRQGTSLRLSYMLQRSAQSLQRLADMALLIDAGLLEAGDTRRERVVERWSAFVRAALSAESQRGSLRSHVANGVAMLAMRVTENAARTGEHYIAETRSDYWAMWRAAMGAGLIIAVMALIKIFTGKLDLAPIGYVVGYSLIYGLGFVVIYMLRLTVATKQPAMTAQTIAGFLGEVRSTGNRRAADLDRVVDLFAGVARTQTAAILGNVIVALPAAVALSLLFVWITGAGPIDIAKADALLRDLDIAGWALPHAALAGVFLFLSGVLTGYFDNQASYARLGERIARLHWLVGIAGARRAGRTGAYIEAHFGGLLGNFFFGCMLGSAGTIGVILGLPIDIRHIAFSSANLGFAWSAYGLQMPLAMLGWAALGMLLIGVVNLAVSFALALWMAMRARAISVASTSGLMRRLGKRFLAAPESFFTARSLPREAPDAIAGSSPVH